MIKTHTVQIIPVDGQYAAPVATMVRVTMNVEGTLSCGVCGEKHLLTGSVDPLDHDDTRTNVDYGRYALRIVTVLLSEAAARFGFGVVSAPTADGGHEAINACRKCRERLQQAIATALRRA